MIIVSQDKKSIINFNNVLKIDCINDEIIVFYKSEEVPGVDGTESIGFYETAERAKEVLQGIIRAYEKAGNIMFETSEDERLLKLTHNSNVFEMPER